MLFRYMKHGVTYLFSTPLHVWDRSKQIPQKISEEPQGSSRFFSAGKLEVMPTVMLLQNDVCFVFWRQTAHFSHLTVSSKSRNDIKHWWGRSAMTYDVYFFARTKSSPVRFLFPSRNPTILIFFSLHVKDIKLWTSKKWKFDWSLKSILKALVFVWQWPRRSEVADCVATTSANQIHSLKIHFCGTNQMTRTKNTTYWDFRKLAKRAICGQFYVFAAISTG